MMYEEGVIIFEFVFRGRRIGVTVDLPVHPRTTGFFWLKTDWHYPRTDWYTTLFSLKTDWHSKTEICGEQIDVYYCFRRTLHVSIAKKCARFGTLFPKGETDPSVCNADPSFK